MIIPLDGELLVHVSHVMISVDMVPINIRDIKEVTVLVAILPTSSEIAYVLNDVVLCVDATVSVTLLVFTDV